MILIIYLHMAYGSILYVFGQPMRKGSLMDV